jgi:hypothetical protein
LVSRWHASWPKLHSLWLCNVQPVGQRRLGACAGRTPNPRKIRRQRRLCGFTRGRRVARHRSTNANTNPNAKTNRNTNPNAKTNHNTNHNAKTNRNTNPNAKTNRNTNPNAKTNRNTNPNAIAIAFPDAHAKPVTNTHSKPFVDKPVEANAIGYLS